MAGIKRVDINLSSKDYVFFVYKTTNNINGKYYIGSHCGPKINDPKNDYYLGSGVRLKAALRKYGTNNFVREILSEHNSIQEMFEEENRQIALHIKDENCYNLTEVAGGGIIANKYKTILQLNKFGEVIAEYEGVTVLPQFIPHTNRAWNVAAYIAGRTDNKMLRSGGFIWILKEELGTILPERLEEALQFEEMKKTNPNPAFCLMMDIHIKEDNIELINDLFKQTIQSCKEKKVSIIIQGGDVFNSRKALSQNILTCWTDFLDLLQKEGITLYSIPGNHDKVDQESESSWLDLWKHHPSFKVFTKETSINWINSNYDFHFLPYFKESGSYTERLRKIIASLDKRKKHLLFTHIGIAGGIDNDHLSNTIPTELFKSFEKVYCAHYHNEVEVNEIIHYLGSFYQGNFGETLNKGINWLYSDGTLEKQVLKFPQYLTYEVDVKSMTTKDIEDLKVEKQQSQDYIRVTLKGAEKDLKAFNKQSLEAIGIKVQLQQEEIKIEELEARIEPFDSKSLAEEFEVFCKKNKLNHKEGLKYFNQIVK